MCDSGQDDPRSNSNHHSGVPHRKHQQSMVFTMVSKSQLFSGTLFPFFWWLPRAAPLKMVFPKKGSLFFSGSLNN